MPAYPKMILFDYGHTLLYEPGFNTLKGEKALFPYLIENPYGVSAEELNAFSKELFLELDISRHAGYEVHEYPALRYKNDYFGLKYSVSMEEAERILWDGFSPGAVMPGAETMLRYLDEAGIRSGVISNIGFSEHALTERINRLLPENRFEFILASSEYVFRKPSRRLFDLALRKAGLRPDEVWYCGDSPSADIAGAHAAGIFPVWYDNSSGDSYVKPPEAPPACRHLHIHDWSELTSYLDEQKK